MKKTLLLFITHLAVGTLGFGAGIYFLPILTAPPAPDLSAVQTAAQDYQYTGKFHRDLKDSDALHWGEGTLFISNDTISLQGKIAPGPAYKLYLSPEFIETEERFRQLKPKMSLIGDVKTFENFILPIPADIDASQFNTAIIWCESFDQFITAGLYQ